MIELKNVSMKFADAFSIKEEFQALQDISLSIPDGCIYGFLGSNGAGKSTLMRMISGVYKTQSGSIQIDGEEVYDCPQAKEKLFFVNDETIQYTKFNLEQLKEFYKEFYPNFSEEIFYRLCENFSIDIKKKLQKFSKGMKRQAIVIVALACQTKYLLLDEAFDGLDPAMRKIVKQMIMLERKERNMTIIISSHNISEISELCDQAMLLHHGQIIFANQIHEITSNFRKIQIIKKDLQFICQDIVKLGINVIQYKNEGSVVQIVVRGKEEDIIEKLKPLAADIIETIPLTLEEIFIYELEVRGYGTDIFEAC